MRYVRRDMSHFTNIHTGKDPTRPRKIQTVTHVGEADIQQITGHLAELATGNLDLDFQRCNLRSRSSVYRFR